MTTQTEALKLALEALDQLTNVADTFSVSGVYLNEEVWAKKCLSDAYFAITTIEQVLAQQSNEQVEPTCWITPDGEGFRMRMTPPVNDVPLGWTPLFDHPPVPKDEQVEPVAKKWLLHGSFADVASFDTEGFPSFYSKESFTKFKNGELSAPCKGKNCGSLNGWLHSAECRAEHESHYTHPPVPTAQPEQEPVAWIDLEKLAVGGMAYATSWKTTGKQNPLYTTPPQRKPLTDEQIADIVIEMNGNEPTALFWRDLAQAIEAAHGIKE